MSVDRAIVISLKRRLDRRTAFYRGLPQPWPFPSVAWLIATDGLDDHRADWMAGAGAWGCAQSHVRALRSAICAKVDSVLIMEDDARFVPDFTHRWSRFAAALPGDWEMLMLGGEHFVAPRPVNTEVVRCVSTLRTHAYIVRSRALTSLEGLWQRAQDHIDMSLPRFQAKHPTYAPASFLVHQAPGRSDVPKMVPQLPREMAALPAGSRR